MCSFCSDNILGNYNRTKICYFLISLIFGILFRLIIRRWQESNLSLFHSCILWWSYSLFMFLFFDYK
jgi:hypothetical protein